MKAEDRRFYGILALAFGPLFIAGGWLAAFTDVGWVLILLGAAMLLASPVLLRSLRTVPLVAILVALGLGWPYLFFAL
ncbi:MAG: hypothetical protein GEU75_10025 [Dehalococcoidia bacterium]|nr:hypothetical protein [Dehalococcoidia bacterium]